MGKGWMISIGIGLALVGLVGITSTASAAWFSAEQEATRRAWCEKKARESGAVILERLGPKNRPSNEEIQRGNEAFVRICLERVW